MPLLRWRRKARMAGGNDAGFGGEPGDGSEKDRGING